MFTNKTCNFIACLFLASEKPKVISISKGDVKKHAAPATGSQTRRSESRHKVSTQKEVAGTEKLPNKIKHPDGKGQNRDQGRQPGRVNEPKRLSRDRTRTRTLSPREVKVTRRGPAEETVQSEKLKQEQKQVAENTAAMSAAAVAESAVSLIQGSADSCNQPEDDDGGYEYEDDFEVL
jgi:hypothetical protein